MNRRSLVTVWNFLGTETVDVQLSEYDVTVAEPTGGDSVDVRRAAERALEEPLGRPLASTVDPDGDVAIVVTDVTRTAPDDVLLEALLERLLAWRRPRTGDGRHRTGVAPTDD